MIKLIIIEIIIYIMKALIPIDLYTLPYSFNKPVNGMSQLASIVTIITVFLFTIFTVYTQIYNRTLTSIIYLGFQPPAPSQLENNSFKLDLDINSSRFKCNFFYKVFAEDQPVFFDKNIKLNLNVSFTSENNEYEIKFFSKCSQKLDFAGLSFKIKLDYVATKSNFFDVYDPILKYNNSFTDLITYNLTLADKNFAETLPYNLYVLNYFYNKIVDDKNFFRNKEINFNDDGMNYFSTEDVIKYESLQPFPQLQGTSPFQYYPANHLFTIKLINNRKTCNLIRRNFTLIPQILSNIVGVFSLMKFLSLSFLCFFNFYFKEFYLMNKIFDFNYKQNEVKTDNSSQKQESLEINMNINNEKTSQNMLLQNLKTYEKNFFTHFDNIRFFCFCQSKKTRLKYQIFKSLKKWKLDYHEFDYWMNMIDNLKYFFQINNDVKTKIIINEPDSYFEIIHPNQFLDQKLCN